MNRLTKSAVFAATAVIFMAPAISLAGAIVILNNPGSATLHEIEVTPGSTFSVDVNLETSTIRRQIWTYARASESGVFQITSLTGQAPWRGYNGIGRLSPVSMDLRLRRRARSAWR